MKKVSSTFLIFFLTLPSPARSWSSGNRLSLNLFERFSRHRVTKKNGYNAIQQPSENSLFYNESSSSSIQSPRLARAAQLADEAKQLRLKAKELMAEALSMEADLMQAKSNREKEKVGNSTELIRKVFDSRPLTPEAVAQAMKNERVSAEQAHSMLEQLFQDMIRYQQIPAPPEPSSQTKISEIGPNATMSIVQQRVHCIIDAAEIIDRNQSPDIRIRWSDNVASSLKSQYHQFVLTLAREATQRVGERQDQPQTAQTRQDSAATSASSANMTRSAIYSSGLEGTIYPPWIPVRLMSLFKNSTTFGKISSEDVTTMKQKVLTESRFVCTSSESTSSAAIFRGRIRPQSEEMNQLSSTKEPMPAEGTSTSDLYHVLETGMKKEGLNDRLQFFLMNDPAEQIDLDHPTPVVLVIPANVTPAARTLSTFRKFFAQLSVIFTSWTLSGYAISSYALNPKFFSFIVERQDSSVLFRCAPVFLGVVGIQLLHEMVHFVIARSRGMRIGWPMPLPSVSLGTYGCITELKSFPANRKDLFDFSMGGPIAGAVSSLVCMLIGIHKTLHASSHVLGDFPFVPVSTLKSSFLVGTLMTFLAPKVLALPLSQPVPIHPLFVVGFSGMISSALNLLPIFRLDGGRACDAAMGSRYSEFASATTLMFLFSNIISKGANPILSTWFMFILLLQRNHEVPPRDEWTKLCRTRFSGWLCALALSILALLPFPGYRRPSLYSL